MRRLLLTFVVLLGCWFAAQSTIAATSAYGDCCLEGCKGMSNCIGANCQVCTTPAAATEPAASRRAATAGEIGALTDEQAAPSPYAEIWNPPD